MPHARRGLAASQRSAPRAEHGQVGRPGVGGRAARRGRIFFAGRLGGARLRAPSAVSRSGGRHFASRVWTGPGPADPIERAGRHLGARAQAAAHQS
ncbi:hypothetical protein G6F21_014622 [Rhizopus arrhizus]|nr:hypothetical protein G6F21_014622 [Rhizopus arrhizus]